MGCVNHFRGTTREIVERWGSPSCLNSPIIAVCLDNSTAAALMNKDASAFLCLVRWFSMGPEIFSAFTGGPPLEWAKLVCREHVQKNSFELLTAEGLMDFLHQVRTLWQVGATNLRCEEPESARHPNRADLHHFLL